MTPVPLRSGYFCARMFHPHQRSRLLSWMVILVVIVLRPSHSLNAQSEVGMKQVRPVVPISQAQWEGVADSLEVQMHQTVHSLAAAEVVEASSPASESFIPPVRMDAVQLDQIPASSRIAALAATAGVDMVSAGAGMLRPVLRGLSGLRIATLFNGARIESQAWGEYHGIYIPEEGIERVEIIRGPGTLAHGSDAYGGVLNFVPNQVLQERGRKSQVSWSGFSATNGLQATAATEKRSQSTFHSFRGGYKRHGDYRLPSGEALFNSAYTQFFAQGTFGYIKSWGSIEGAYSSSYNNADIIGHDGWSQSGDHLVTTSMQLRWGAWQLVPRFSYQLNHRLEFDQHVHLHVGGNAGDELLDSIALDMSLRTLRYDLKAERTTEGGWSWILGSQGFTSSNTNEPEELDGPGAPLIRDAEIKEVSGFAISSWKGDKIGVEASVRGDVRQTQWDALNVLLEETRRNDWLGSAALGMHWDVSERLIARWHVARSQRVPGLSELFSSGLHHCAYRIEMGDQTLENETSYNIEWNTRWQGRSLSMESSVYRNAIEDYVYLAPTKESFDGVPEFAYTSTEALFLGAEFTGEWSPVRWSHIGAKVAISVVEATDGMGSELPLTPPFTARVQSGWSGGEWAGFDEVFAYVVVNYSRDATLLHWTSGARISENMHCVLSIQNLLNVEYYPTLSMLRNLNIPESGRNIRLRLEWRF